MTLIFFLLGLVVGSFLNVVILRLDKPESLFMSHSRCPACKHALQANDLLPVLSFVFLAGRCRFCQAHISWQYPLVEFATGLLFAVFALHFSLAFDLVFWLFFAASFVVIVAFDFRYKLVPDAITWPLCVGVFVYILLPLLVNLRQTGVAQVWQALQPHILAAIITGGFILLLVVITQERGMGMGDVPIAALQGWLLGFPGGVIALGLSFIIGALISIALLVTSKATMKTAVPFTPFLIVGLLIVYFFW